MDLLVKVKLFFQLFSSVLLAVFSLSAILGLVLVRTSLGEKDLKPNLWSLNLNFHTYNIAQESRKVKKNFRLIYCTILLSGGG